MNKDKHQIIYAAGGIELLEAVKPMWEQLNRHHREKSAFFTEYFEAMTFEKRVQKLLDKIAENNIFIVLAMNGDNVYGYCISTIDTENVGEIDSLYIDSTCRGMGIGFKLMELSLEWLDSKGAVQKRISVASGNEEVFEFYKKFGFYPRYTMLLEKGE